MTDEERLQRSAESWVLLTKHVLEEPDVRKRQMLEVVARHVEAEVRGDVDALMATLVPEPRYEFYGAAPVAAPVGATEVRQWYADLVASGMNLLEYPLTRVLVDADAVITDGTFRQVFDRLTVEGLGHAVSGDDADLYLVEYRALIMWPFEQGLIQGEIIFAGTYPAPIRSVAPEEFPHLLK